MHGIILRTRGLGILLVSVHIKNRPRAAPIGDLEAKCNKACVICRRLGIGSRCSHVLTFQPKPRRVSWTGAAAAPPSDNVELTVEVAKSQDMSAEPKSYKASGCLGS